MSSSTVSGIVNTSAAACIDADKRQYCFAFNLLQSQNSMQFVKLNNKFF